MNMKTFLSAVATAAIVVWAFACGDSGDVAVVPAVPVAGGAVPAPVPDAGPAVEPDSTPAPKLLRPGLAYVVGATTSHVVASVGAAGYEVIPVDGGPAVLLGSSERLVVSGGAVAWWTGLSEGFGALSVWNATDGVKKMISTRAFAGEGPSSFFAATADGRRIAYWEGDSKSTTALHVLDLATGESSPADGALSPRYGVDAVACDLTASFHGKKLIASYCDATGTPRFFAVPGDRVLGARVDPGYQAVQIQSWSADAAGNRLYVQRVAQRRADVIDITNVDDVKGDDIDADEGFVTKDGAAFVYRFGMEVRRREGETVTRIATPVARLHQLSSDDASALANDGQSYVILDTRKATPPTVLTAATTAVPQLTVSGRWVMTQVLQPNLATLNVGVSSASGGAARELASGVMSSVLSPAADALVTFGKVDLTPGVLPSGELQYIDVATGKSTNLGGDVLPGPFAGKKLVFMRLKGPDAGIYVFDPG